MRLTEKNAAKFGRFAKALIEKYRKVQETGDDDDDGVDPDALIEKLGEELDAIVDGSSTTEACPKCQQLNRVPMGKKAKCGKCGELLAA